MVNGDKNIQKRVDIEVAKLLKKEEKKLVKRTARQELKRLRTQERRRAQPVRQAVKEVGQVERRGVRRQKALGILGSRAEQIEIQMVTLNEVPMLRDQEGQRARGASPPNREFAAFEKQVTDSFPQ